MKTLSALLISQYFMITWVYWEIVSALDSTQTAQSLVTDRLMHNLRQTATENWLYAFSRSSDTSVCLELKTCWKVGAGKQACWSKNLSLDFAIFARLVASNYYFIYIFFSEHNCELSLWKNFNDITVIHVIDIFIGVFLTTGYEWILLCILQSTIKKHL